LEMKTNDSTKEGLNPCFTQGMVQTIRQALTAPDIRLAILFGSQASGITHAGSDADVAMALDGEMSPSRLGELSACLSAALGCEVDVVDLRKAQGEFLAQIVLGGKVAVKRDSSLLAEFALKALAYREDMRPMVLQALKAKVRRSLNG
jgi:predicted nucleotidyltransferase